MFGKLKLLKRVSFHNNDSMSLLINAINILDELSKDKLSHLDIKDYKYDSELAIEELGIDEELLVQLLDDYVTQIIKSVVKFEEYIRSLKTSKRSESDLDYTLFRELAHKNLGVARNLRVRDGEILLTELMKKDDLDYLILCFEALEMCAIRLAPQSAYNALKELNTKN